MNSLLGFMSSSPFLTFFLALIIGEVIRTFFKAIGGKYRTFSWDKHYQHKENMARIEAGSEE